MSRNPTQIGPLAHQFGIDGAVRFDTGRGGLPCAVLSHRHTRAVAYPHGSHVTSYLPEADAPDALFVSPRSAFAAGEPIRGGIPVCFPWFADHGTPKHGPVRLESWRVTDTAADDDAARLELATDHGPFRITCRISAGAALELAVRVENVGDAPATFELALHSYFAVADVTNVEIHGLSGRDYLDKTREMNQFTQDGPIRIDREVDRVYQHTADTCTLHDPGHGRTIEIEKRDLLSTIVWNPWRDKGAAQPDLADDDWLRFVCIESGNVHDNAVTLAPGEAHEGAARIQCRAMSAT